MNRDNKMFDGLQSALIEGEDYDHSVPEHRLAAAVINRAVLDYLCTNIKYDVSEQKRSEHYKWKTRAMTYLTAPDGPEVCRSFKWWLAWLTNDPESLHTKILAKCGLLH
jgi:hypothetical protein